MFKNTINSALLNFWLFLSFSTGIILGAYFNSFLTFFIFSLISVILLFVFYKKQNFFLSDSFILILFISLGALSYITQQYQKIDSFLNEEKKFIIKVISLPQERHFKNTFLAEIKAINTVIINSTVRVMDHTKKMDYLNIYELKAKLTKHQYQKRDFYTLWVRSNAVPKDLPLNIWDKFTKKVSYNLMNIFKNNLSDESYRFLSSVFLGRRELLEKEEKDIFRDAGISHLLAISGSNISLVAAVLFFILKLFNIKFRPRLAVALIFLSLYTIITGANPPVARATIMYLVFSLGYFAKRKVNPYNSLGLAGLACLLINPQWLFDVGFQLSFLSIFALILGFRLFIVKASKSIVINYIKYLFFSSWYVTLLITPLISYYFGRIYLLSIFNNLILIPFFSIILIINFVLIVFSPLNFIAQSIGAILSVSISVFYKLSSFLGAIKFSFIECTFPLSMVFIYYAFLAAFLVYKRKAFDKKIAFWYSFPMKKLSILLLLTLFSFNAYSFWIWSPKTQKWKNPKYSPLATPYLQFKEAEKLFNEKNYQDAYTAFKKLLIHYPDSRDAAEAQYYLGRCLEAMNKPYQAFLEYQKVIDSYPNSQRINEVVERQYNIGDYFLNRSPKQWLGVSLYDFMDHPSIEIFKKIVDKVPYSPYASKAQYKLGLLLLKLGRYDEARDEFQKVCDNYPDSEWSSPAKFQLAIATSKASGGADYDSTTVEEATKKLTEFVQQHPEADISPQAMQQLKSLRNREAKKNFDIAEFYLKQKKYKAAAVYYEIVLSRYPDSEYTQKAEAGLNKVKEQGAPKGKEKEK